jgi:hypothetical protein
MLLTARSIAGPPGARAVERARSSGPEDRVTKGVLAQAAPANQRGAAAQSNMDTCRWGRRESGAGRRARPEGGRRQAAPARARAGERQPRSWLGAGGALSTPHVSCAAVSAGRSRLARVRRPPLIESISHKFKSDLHNNKRNDAAAPLVCQCRVPTVGFRLVVTAAAPGRPDSAG